VTDGGDRTYRVVVRLALLVLRVLGFRVELRGVEHLPASGGAVLAINHVSYFDFVFAGLAAHHRGRLVRFLAKREVFDQPLVGRAMAAMGHVPVDRRAGAAAYRHAVAALEAGELVGVFPEATISRSFVPRELKSGAARMALEAQVPLLPVVTWGGQRVWTAGRRPSLRRGVPIVVVVDPPLPVGPTDSAATLTTRLARRLDELVGEAVRGYPGLGDEHAWWMPRRFGGGAPTPESTASAEDAAIGGEQPGVGGTDSPDPPRP
jgi:1-acyl-sn-glycerol-3-phosphate acyltransferase